MADQLILVDGTQRVVEDGPAGTLYRLAVRIEGAIARSSAADLGPSLSALYGQTLAAVLADRTLSGLAVDVAEGGQGDEDVAGLEVEVAREAYTAPTAMLGLHCVITYWQPAGTVAQREAILDALTATLGANAPLPVLTVRERVLVALEEHVASALGVAVERNATRPQEEAAVVLVEGDQVAYHDTLGLTVYRQAVAFEAFVPAATEDQLDATCQAIHGAIRSAGQLGGLAIDVDLESTDPEVLRQEYTGPLLAARIDCAVWYATAEGDPTVVAS